MTTTDQTWRDVTEMWQATLALLKSVEVERGRAVLQCIASDEELLKALGMAEALYKAAGDVPIEVVVRLNDGAGAHIRTHAYKYDKLISQELVRIKQVKDIQWRALALAGSALVAAMIGTANLFSRLYFRVLESEDVAESKRWLLALLFPVGAVVGLLLLRARKVEPGVATHRKPPPRPVLLPQPPPNTHLQSSKEVARSC